MGWLWSERILNAMGSDAPGDLVIVKKNPALGLETLIGVGRSELAGGFGQPHQISHPTGPCASLSPRARGLRPSYWSWRANSHLVSGRRQNRPRPVPSRGQRN